MKTHYSLFLFKSHYTFRLFYIITVYMFVEMLDMEYKTYNDNLLSVFIFILGYVKLNFNGLVVQRNTILLRQENLREALLWLT